MKKLVFSSAIVLVTFLISPTSAQAQTVACPYPIGNIISCNISGTVTFYYFNGSTNVPCGAAISFSVNSGDPAQNINCNCGSNTAIAVSVNVTAPTSMSASAPPPSQPSTSGGCLGQNVMLNTAMGGTTVEIN